MTIWRDGLDPVREAAKAGANTLMDSLGIEIIEAGDDWLKGRMPVDQRTKQPFGLLHGGASVALAETIASWAGTLSVGADQMCVGVEINANHLRPVTSGWVYAVATPESRGRTLQVWTVRISDEAGRLVCISRMTLAVRDRARGS